MEIGSQLLYKFVCKVVSKYSKYVMLKGYDRCSDSVHSCQKMESEEIWGRPKKKHGKKLGVRRVYYLCKFNYLSHSDHNFRNSIMGRNNSRNY